MHVLWYTIYLGIDNIDTNQVDTWTMKLISEIRPLCKSSNSWNFDHCVCMFDVHVVVIPWLDEDILRQLHRRDQHVFYSNKIFCLWSLSKNVPFNRFPLGIWLQRVFWVLQTFLKKSLGLCKKKSRLFSHLWCTVGLCNIPYFSEIYEI